VRKISRNLFEESVTPNLFAPSIFFACGDKRFPSSSLHLEIGLSHLADSFERKFPSECSCELGWRGVEGWMEEFKLLSHH